MELLCSLCLCLTASLEALEIFSNYNGGRMEGGGKGATQINRLSIYKLMSLCCLISHSHKFNYTVNNTLPGTPRKD